MKKSNGKHSNHNPKKKNLIEVLGPVEDLESYVKADWWKHLFNANYLRTDGDVVSDETITINEIDLFLKILSPEKNSFILDLCCGQGRHSIELAKRGYKNIVGMDRSHYLINKARSINLTEGFGITFKEGDARKLPFTNDKFDFVLILGNSFGYFETMNDDVRVLNEVLRVLKPSGKVLIDITDGNYMMTNYEPRSWEWIDKSYFVCRERSLSKDSQRLISREVITHVKKGVIADQFYAERLYTDEKIKKLLKKCRFVDIELEQELLTSSQRNQDLGMMGRRLILVGTANKEWSMIKEPHKAIRTVAVLMGDPRKQDKIKPNATFDDDDMYTINELKKGLSKIHNFKFSYFDNHNTMINDLSKIKKNDLVFNLCDEGFNNEPTKELHVPALLEVAQIPFTGGTPQCLAYCYDKSLVRGIAEEMDIPVPQALFIKPEDTNFIELTISFPVIVKPNFGDSSYGITQDSVCYNIESLENAINIIREKFGYQQPILVEEFLTGKDISVGIIGNPPNSYLTLPIIEEDYSELPEGLPKICGYEAKWDPASPYWKIKSIPAKLAPDRERFLIASCIKLFERLGCRDYARFDWRLDNNRTPRLLEANPNPGWCWDGHLAKMAKIAGISYSGMLQKIIEAAMDRVTPVG
ncbi:methyltransferase domain-containing protein [candidate division KSB1 bacterium]|nr:methyltransferase domain-containing protein [candidate division KSB1 bacterium]